ncbi:MAG: hypothetical protein FWG68_07490 [Defluviitaleaceae bacterium]|nr:hypothetical protein [Defluviitaleaceae bacterium]
MKNPLLRLIFLSLQVRFVNMTNRLIYFFQKLPLLKRLISADIYKSQDLKTVFLILGVFFVVSKKFMFFLLYWLILLPIGLAVSHVHTFDDIFDAFNPEIEAIGTFGAADVFGNMLVAWFIISFLGAAINSTLIASEHWQNDEVMVNLLRVNPVQYGKSRIFADRASDLIIWLPTLLVAYFFVIDAGFLTVLWAAVATLVVYTAFRLFAEFTNLWLFRKFRKHLGSNGWIAFGYMSTFIILGFIAPFFLGTPDFNALFGIFSPIFVILAIGVIFVLVRYIKNYLLFFDVFNETIQRSRAAIDKYYQAGGSSGSLGADQKSAQDWAKKLDTTVFHEDKHSHKTGLSYLNAIFFERHRQFFRKKMLLRIALLVAPLILALLTEGFLRIFISESLQNFFVQDLTAAEVYNELADLFRATPFFFIIVYAFSMGRLVTGAVFTNCDIHMLHYPYYRQAQVILASFRVRMKMIFGLNLLLTSLLGVSVVGILWLALGVMNWQSAALFFTIITLMGLTLGFSDLFLYYIIQPYDSDGKGKSLAYNVINWVVYMLSFVLMQVQIELTYFALAWLAISVVYFGIGTAALVRVAPWRFRLR